jgi:hypothetical protein
MTSMWGCTYLSVQSTALQNAFSHHYVIITTTTIL